MWGLPGHASASVRGALSGHRPGEEPRVGQECECSGAHHAGPEASSPEAELSSEGPTARAQQRSLFLAEK